MAVFEIWKRGDVYEVIFREGEGVSALSYSKNLATAKRRLEYHKSRMKKGHLLKEDPSVLRISSQADALLRRIL